MGGRAVPRLPLGQTRRGWIATLHGVAHDITPPLEVDVQRSGASLTVRLSGEVDAATADRVEEALNASALDSVTDVALDLDGISFLDSSGLRSLLHLRDRATDAGATVSVASASSVVVRLFELTGLTDQFPTVGS